MTDLELKAYGVFSKEKSLFRLGVSSINDLPEEMKILVNQLDGMKAYRNETLKGKLVYKIVCDEGKQTTLVSAEDLVFPE